MVTPSEMLTFLLVFLVGFIAGKLFAALQFAGMMKIGKAAREEVRGLVAKYAHLGWSFRSVKLLVTYRVPRKRRKAEASPSSFDQPHVNRRYALAFAPHHQRIDFEVRQNRAIRSKQIG